MARRNWMPLYIPDFLADTMHLTAAETGAYLSLIMDYWLHDGLPDDDRKLAQIARLPLRLWLAMRPTIAAFFHDGWRHKRIDAELEKMEGVMTRRKAAAVKAGTMSVIARNRQRDVQRQANVTLTNRSTSGQRDVNHSTKKDSLLTSSFLLTAARAREDENQTETTTKTEQAEPKSGLAMEESRSMVATSDDLKTSILRKGWIA